MKLAPIVKTITKNKWVSLRTIIFPEHGKANNDGYFYLHEDRCNGKIVSILPYRKNNFTGFFEFLLRSELTPCWDAVDNCISSITGGVDEGNDLTTTVILETKEETGYDIDFTEITNLGTCRGSKSNDSTYYLFGVNLTGMKQGEATGDGSELEALAHCEWHPSISASVDPLSYVSFCRLKEKGII